ncbi:MAG: GTP-binding protein [Candidatus Omnitrophica bacterium]|nr:GTP-binding protein [Candidatus Omnitrophota bacterium]
MTDQLKIAVCGHIDHGKSTLIGRLLLDTGSLPDDKIKDLKRIAKDFDEETQLAYLTDQLKEERERNITIETTQIFLKTKKRPYCLIDTPGHLEFIKNMLSGASQAEAAMLVVDISEGIQDQTRRHAYLLHFLSLQNIIILVNKMDLTQYSQQKFQEVEKQIQDLFNGLKLKPRQIIPVSAKLGENISRRSKHINWYHGPCLTEALDTIPSNSDKRMLSQDLRLPIQDIYDIDEEKIIVGKIAAGILREGQTVTLLPKGINTKIKALKVFNTIARSASVDENVGLTLTTDIPGLQRGDVICANENAPKNSKRFMGNLVWLHSTALSKGQKFELHCATQTLSCSVTRILERVDPKTLTILETDAQLIAENQAGIVEFELLKPALIEKHSAVPELGRYSIENDQGLLGAGTVLENYV